MRRIALILAFGLLLAACSSQVAETFSEVRRGLDSEGTADFTNATSDGFNAEEAPASFDVRFNIVDDRKVIRQASLQLHASNTREAFDEIVRLTESVGGFVSHANVLPSGANGDEPDVSVTVRIPADQLTPTMTAIKASVDSVVSESQGAQDVTDRFVDLEAQLTNLRALEVELRALLEEVRKQADADPDKLLRVFNEISSVRGQIEQIQGQLNLLSDLTALATLDVQISQTPEAVPIVEEAWVPIEVARDSLRSLVSGLQGIANWGINFVILTLPMLLLVLGIPFAVGFSVYRRIRKARGPRDPAQPAPAGSLPGV